MLPVFVTLILFVLLTGGLGPLLAPRDLRSPVLAVGVGMGLSLVTLFAVTFAVYELGLPGLAAPGLMLLITGLAVARRRERARELWCDPAVQRAGLLWGALLCWLLGWQFSVVVYSGGSWAGDWGEHLQRARFFADHWALDTRFLERYSITARPPLLNVVGAFFFWTTADSGFAGFQVICAATTSLVIWPLLALQARWRPARPGWLLVGLMCLPALLQHGTFTWTKAQTAGFILLALALIRSDEATRPVRRWGLLFLAAACITHYSAGPWVVAIGLAWVVAQPGLLRTAFTRTSLVDALPGLGLLAVWFGWAFLHFGLGEALTSNSTVTPGVDMSWGFRVRAMLFNLESTFVPLFFVGAGTGPLYSLDPLVQLRDTWFYFLQSNLLGIAGTAGTTLAVALLIRHRRDPAATASARRFWAVLLPTAVGLGIVTHATPVQEGVAHISLLTLALLVVAWVSARAPGDRVIRWLWPAGLAVDVVLGILLHFGIESGRLLQWLHPTEDFVAGVQRVGPTAGVNLQGYAVFGAQPLGIMPGAGFIALTLLILALALALAPRWVPQPNSDHGD